MVKRGFPMSNKKENSKTKAIKEIIISIFTWIIMCLLSYMLSPHMDKYWRIIDHSILLIVILSVVIYKNKETLFDKHP